MCQFKHIYEMAEDTSAYVNFIESVRKTLSKIKKSMRLMQSNLSATEVKERLPFLVKRNIQIKQDDTVRVRSKKEIDAMLDHRGTYKGCPFIEGMYSHCDNTYKVLKPAVYFYDEIKKKLCKCKDLVVLEGTICCGKQKLFSVKCDLLCFFFWHKDWLEKVETK